MCCSTTVSKCILIVFNTIFFILGAASIALGALVLVDKSSLLEGLARLPMGDVTTGAVQAASQKTSMLHDCGIMLCVGGGIVFLIAFCGCCGACKGSKRLLTIYAIFIGLILVIQLAAGVMAIVYSDKVESYLNKYLDETIKTKYEGSTFDFATNVVVRNIEPITAAWDFAQAFFECCGNNNFTDWDKATVWNKTIEYSNNTVQSVVPMTCCKMVDNSKFPFDLPNVKFVDIGACITSASSASTNTEGCYIKVKDFIKQYANICLGIGIGVAAIEVFGFIAAICLCQAVSKERNGIA